MIQQKEGKNCHKHKEFTPHSSQLHTPDRLISFLSKRIRPPWCRVSKTRTFSHKTFASVSGKMHQMCSLHAGRGPAQAPAHNIHQWVWGDAIIQDNVFNASHAGALSALCTKAAELRGSRRCSPLQARTWQPGRGRGEWQGVEAAQWSLSEFAVTFTQSNPSQNNSLLHQTSEPPCFFPRALNYNFFLIPLEDLPSSLAEVQLCSPQRPSTELVIFTNNYFPIKSLVWKNKCSL